MFFTTKVSFCPLATLLPIFSHLSPNLSVYLLSLQINLHFLILLGKWNNSAAPLVWPVLPIVIIFKFICVVYISTSFLLLLSNSLLCSVFYFIHSLFGHFQFPAITKKTIVNVYLKVFVGGTHFVSSVAGSQASVCFTLSEPKCFAE